MKLVVYHAYSFIIHLLISTHVGTYIHQDKIDYINTY